MTKQVHKWALFAPINNNYELDELSKMSNKKSLSSAPKTFPRTLSSLFARVPQLSSNLWTPGEVSEAVDLTDCAEATGSSNEGALVKEKPLSESSFLI